MGEPNSSQSLPLFEKSCHEVLTRLEGDASDGALEFNAQARELLAILDSWKQELPEPSFRTSTVSRILDLYQHVLTYIATAKTDPPQG